MGSPFKPNHAKEVLIQLNGRWHIAQLGVVKIEGKPSPVWVDREGAVYCNIGDEDRMEELPE